MSAYAYEEQYYTPEQRYRRVATNSEEQKEPKKRPTKRPSLRGSASRTQTPHLRQHSPSTSSLTTSTTNTNPIAPHWKERLRRAGIVTAILVVLMITIILMAALVTIAEKLRTLVAISTSLSCPTG
ncbi:hypothetical protein DL93DRAFT_2174328 [Clavulina sp. PMI_390]|nr:hypothetical protein DL93DRAFT_2174328 [Clavulina sp. PMI_390]